MCTGGGSVQRVQAPITPVAPPPQPLPAPPAPPPPPIMPVAAAEKAQKKLTSPARRRRAMRGATAPGKGRLTINRMGQTGVAT